MVGRGWMAVISRSSQSNGMNNILIAEHQGQCRNGHTGGWHQVEDPLFFDNGKVYEAVIHPVIDLPAPSSVPQESNNLNNISPDPASPSCSSTYRHNQAPNAHPRRQPLSNPSKLPQAAKNTVPDTSVSIRGLTVEAERYKFCSRRASMMPGISWCT